MKRFLALMALLAIGAACSDSSNGPGVNAAVQVSFATQPTTAVAASVSGVLADTIVDGGDTLVLTSVEVVMREIELKRVESVDCTTDDCEKFEAGPVLVSLPLTPGAQQRFAIDSVPPASYDEVELDVHKPDDGDPQDQAFISANPDFAEISIRVRGTFNGVTFEYTTDLDVEQELALVPAITVTESSSINVTVFVDVRTWFVVSGVLVDPATANKGQPNESEVANNIKDSFKAFEDDDHSGSDN